MSKYVVYDLEMCKVPKGAKREEFGSRQELIQIGAVMLNEEYKTVDTFMTYVAPRYGFVDSFIEKLTGITPANTQNAPSTEDALNAFLAWIPNDATLVSWSENDPIQIYREIDGKHIEIPELEELLDDSIDCQWEFEDKIGASRAYGLSEALSITGIECDKGAHDALIDARNTALLFAKINLEPVLQMSKYYLTEDDMVQYRASGLLPKLSYAQ